MDPMSPRVQHVLRFSGVDNHDQVLKALETSRLRQDSVNLFGGDTQVDMFVRKDTATLEISANKSSALHFAGGFVRALYRETTGHDPKPTLINGPACDLFERTIGSNN